MQTYAPNYWTEATLLYVCVFLLHLRCRWTWGDASEASCRCGSSYRSLLPLVSSPPALWEERRRPSRCSSTKLQRSGSLCWQSRLNWRQGDFLVMEKTSQTCKALYAWNIQVDTRCDHDKNLIPTWRSVILCLWLCATILGNNIASLCLVLGIRYNSHVNTGHEARTTSCLYAELSLAWHKEWKQLASLFPRQD